MQRLPTGWLIIAGYQFENLVVNNRLRLLDLLNIPPDEVVCASPDLQTQTSRQSKCQIDLLIQTKFKTLYACEVKFKGSAIDSSIIPEMEDRLIRLKKPRGFSIRPVLIHVNGVDDSVIDADYFSHIIDFGQFL